MTGQMLRRFGTRRQTTEIELDEAGAFRWTRSGESAFDHGSPILGAPQPAVIAACSAASDGDLVFGLPSMLGHPQRASWQAYGSRSAAELMLPRFDREPRVATMELDWRLLGAGLSVFHDRAAGTVRDIAPASPGLTRLEKWMDAGESSDISGGWRAELIGTIGVARWRVLRDSVAALTLPTEHDAAAVDPAPVLHGWCSLGSIVLPEVNNRPAVILTGPEICWGRAEYDLGTLIGELTEYAFIAAVQNLDEQPYRLSAGALVAGYTGPLDPELLSAASVIRILLHTHDFAAYVGWTDELAMYAEMLCEVLDAANKPFWGVL